MRSYIILFLLLTLAACSKKSKVDPVARDITGTVKVTDEFGVATNDVLGFTVTLRDGTKEYSTQTIQNGRYNFSQIPFGKYSLSVSKTGFGTNKRFGIQHVKSVDSASYPLQLAPIGITQMSSTTVTYCAALGMPNGTFDFWMGISPATGPGTTPRFYRIFAGTDSLVAPDHWDMWTPALSLTGTGQSGNFRSLLRQDFPVGSNAWVRIYGDSGANNMYYDSILHEYVFPCLNMTTQPPAKIIIQ